MIARRAYIIFSEATQLIMLTYGVYPYTFLFEIFILIFAISTIQSIWTFISTDALQLKIFQYKKLVMMGLKGLLLLFILHHLSEMYSLQVRALLLTICFIVSSILDDYLLMEYTKNLREQLGFNKQEEIANINPLNLA